MVVSTTKAQEHGMDIKVLGPGCPKCKKTEEIVRQAVAESGVDAAVEKVTNLTEIVSYGVMGTPAVVVNGVVRCVGKVPRKEEVLTWLK
jgi:small redox-active disulfide protein 2